MGASGRAGGARVPRLPLFVPAAPSTADRRDSVCACAERILPLQDKARHSAIDSVCGDDFQIANIPGKLHGLRVEWTGKE